MKVVLYTDDLEPITILDLPPWLLRQGEAQRRVSLQLMVPMPPIEQVLSDETTYPQPPIVTVAFECMRWKDGTLRWMLTTPDETLALLLRPAWLPGQQSTINAYERRIRALTDALYMAFARRMPPGC